MVDELTMAGEVVAGGGLDPVGFQSAMSATTSVSTVAAAPMIVAFSATVRCGHPLQFIGGQRGLAVGWCS